MYAAYLIHCNSKEISQASRWWLILNPLKPYLSFASFICDQIQSAKHARPGALTQDIAFFCARDKWGLPIVPTVGSRLKASKITKIK